VGDKRHVSFKIEGGIATVTMSEAGSRVRIETNAINGDWSIILEALAEMLRLLRESPPLPLSGAQ
jgi:hypothetical protein